MCLSTNNTIDFDQCNRRIKGKLYKYYPIKDYHIDTFRNSQLFFPKPMFLNDSFDTSEKLIDPYNKFKKLVKWDSQKASILNSHGICSFIESNSVKNGRMWAFYANNYNGFAIEYDKRALVNDYYMLRPLPVMYLKNPLDLDNLDLKIIINNESFCIRDISNDSLKLTDRIFQCIHLEKERQLWADENEWRMIIGNIALSQKDLFMISEHEKGYYLSLKNNPFCKLYIGYRVSHDQRSALVDIATSQKMQVAIVTPKIRDKKWNIEISDL